MYARPISKASKLWLTRTDIIFKGGFTMEHLNLYMKNIGNNIKSDLNTKEMKIIKYSDNAKFGKYYPEVIWFVMKMPTMVARSALF